MPAESPPINLTNHFLIAMPGVEGEPFARSVVYLCEHNERGALGLIINKAGEISIEELFDKIGLKLQREDLTGAPVLQGGPVQTERGFILHDAMRVEGEDSAEAVYASTLRIPGADLEMTTSRDVLEALSTGAGPRRVQFMLGYSAWGEGQLESELGENSWLTVGADPAIIFDTPLTQRYERALGLLGLQPWMLSPTAGHA